jgi:2'-5' RNA ligase
MGTKTVFFALWPDNRQRDRMRDFISSVVKTVEGHATDRREWHITLSYLGEIDEAFIPELARSAKAITFEPFRIRLDRMEYWPRPKIAAMVPPRVPPDLEKLVDELNGLVLAAGIEPAQRIYRPHVTVVRNARPFETERLAQSAITEWSSFELMESTTERGVTTYRPLLNDF